MLVKEVVQKTLEVKLTDLAKELSIGEKKLRETLKDLECEPLGVGKRGWEFKGEDGSILEKSIFDFVEVDKRKSNNKSEKAINNASIETNVNNNASIKTNKNVNTDNSKSNSRSENDMVADIKALIKGNNKNENARVYKGVYFDKDIAHFLDNVQHGNKSEIINKILRQYLVDNELM